MFTVSNTLMWAVLTGPTDWVCHIIVTLWKECWKNHRYVPVCKTYAMRRGGCLELYYCNMVEWFWWDSCLISTTNWFPSVPWHCWFGHNLACKNRPRMTYNVSSGTLNPTHSLVTAMHLKLHGVSCWNFLSFECICRNDAGHIYIICCFPSPAARLWATLKLWYLAKASRLGYFRKVS